MKPSAIPVSVGQGRALLNHDTGIIGVARHDIQQDDFVNQTGGVAETFVN